MTPEERAVIDTAMVWAFDRSEYGIKRANLLNACDVLAEARTKPPAFDRLVRSISVRASNVMRREGWSDPQVMAGRRRADVMDARNAGPKTAAVWAIALQECGVPCEWAADLEDQEWFQNARTSVQFGRNARAQRQEQEQA